MIFSLFSFQYAKALDRTTVGVFINDYDYAACHTIVELFDTEAESVYGGSCTGTSRWPNHAVSDTLTFSLEIRTDNGIISLTLFWDNLRFYDIGISGKKTLDNLKGFVENMTKKFKKEEIAFVERKWGKRLSEMNAKELCCASLTLQYWKWDFHW